MLSNQPFFLEGSADNHQASLLLHGLGGGAFEMQLLGQYLNQQGLAVQGINYPGHDQPVPKMLASTWQQWYQHALETYQKLTQRYQLVSVIGMSTGCPLGLYLAATNPVYKLVMLSPFLLVKREWYYLLPPEVYLHSIGRLVEDIPRFKVLPVEDKAMQVAAAKVRFCQTFNLSTARSAVELINRVKPLLPQIKVPALIIQSLKDRVVDPSGAKFLYQQLGSSVKQLHWLHKSNHVITLDVERADVFAQTGAFLGASQSLKDSELKYPD